MLCGVPRRGRRGQGPDPELGRQEGVEGAARGGGALGGSRLRCELALPGWRETDTGATPLPCETAGQESEPSRGTWLGPS